MQYILNNNEQVKVVLMLNAPDFSVARGAPMIAYITAFLRNFSQAILVQKQFDNMINVVIVRNEIFETKEECDFMFKRIIDLYESKVKLKSGESKEDPENIDILCEPQYP